MHLYIDTSILNGIYHAARSCKKDAVIDDYIADKEKDAVCILKLGNIPNMTYFPGISWRKMSKMG
jgi:hypothetical protein